jgi:hypothetical protein
MKCGVEGERVRAKQRLINKRTTISLKGKIGRKVDVSAAQKKVPPIPLGDNPLKLLDRKPFEMHPSCSSFAVKVAAFFGYFLLL